MYPVLFSIGNVSIDTYYVIWFVALALALRWTVGRIALYEIDDDEGRKVIAWGFLGMLLGSRASEYFRNFSTYWSDPSLIFDLTRGGLSERGAILGALIVTSILCWRGGKVSFFRLCEAVVLPGFLAIAIGRWGCFFAGCCIGIQSALPWALHFPRDGTSIARHATQIYYSLSAASILLLLFFIEKWFFRRGLGRCPPRSMLTPLGLIFYSIMRLAIDPLRQGYSGLTTLNSALMVLIPLGAVWFLFSLNAFHKKITAS